jgi:hypothetical protein
MSQYLDYSGATAGTVTIPLPSASGQVLVATGSGTYAWQARTPAAAPLTTFPSNPAATISTGLVMMGLGVTYTPQASGTVSAIANCQATTLVNVINYQIGARYGTGTPPVNGAAATGTRWGYAVDPTGIGFSLSVGSQWTFAQTLALTPGTTYWFDLCLATTLLADAASMSDVAMSIMELWYDLEGQPV